MHPRTSAVLVSILLLACSDSTDPAESGFTDIMAGARSACALTAESRLLCWGDNARGQLAAQGERVLVPAAVPGNPEFSTASVGTSTCAVGVAGSYCWGAGDFANLGNGSTMDHALPQGVRGGLDLVSISAGFSSTCGIAADSTAWCWGLGDRLAVEPPVEPTGPWIRCIFDRLCAGAPVAIEPDRRFISIGVGGSSACAVEADNRGWCWGPEFPGDGTAGPESPHTLAAVSGDLSFATIEPGDERFTCGLTTLGKAWCWGQIDAPDLVWVSLEPVAVAPDFTFSDLAVGANHACGVTPGGTAWCWGANWTGALGDGTTNHSVQNEQLMPTGAANGMEFSGIAAGTDFTCGLTFAGELYCWGANGRGQLGDGTLTGSLVAVQVAWP